MFRKCSPTSLILYYERNIRARRLDDRGILAALFRNDDLVEYFLNKSLYVSG